MCLNRDVCMYQSRGKPIHMTHGYKYIENDQLQVQVQVQGFFKMSLGVSKYQVHCRNFQYVIHKYTYDKLD